LPALSKTAQAGILLGLVLLVRLPFLNQAIQGDDFYYLKAAEHAQIDPVHPNHARYVFQGDLVDMRGHPHPPFNAWYLALLVRLFGDAREVPLHTAYILFSVIAALAAWSIASRFSKQPLLAAALFLVTPAFVVNGNSLESDLPFVAFWLAAIAAFVQGRWWIAAGASSLAALAAYQAVLLTPVLCWWLILNRRRDAPPWIAALAAPLTIALWQLFERLSSGALPATVLAGYMHTYNLQALAQKLRNAGALTAHVAWLIFPVIAVWAFRRAPKWLFAAAGVVAVVAALAHSNPLFWLSAAAGAFLLSCTAHQFSKSNTTNRFLAGWIILFFTAALVIFFAGSVRYLLPIVLPLAILISDRLSSRWLIAGAAAQLALSLALAIVNYQHWNGYREFALSIAPEIARHRTWTNAEWGMRHYLETRGAMPIEKGRAFWPGDLIVTSAYSPEPQTGPVAVIAERTLHSAIPLRIVGLGADSAYSSISFGLAPFAVSRAPLDTVRALVVAERKAVASMLEIGTPAAAEQIISGIYNHDRWVSARGTVLLKRPPGAAQIEARLFIPPQAPARTVRLYVDGRKVHEQQFAAPGAYTVSTPAAGADPATITLEFDRTFSVPPDQRELGGLLLSIGFR
jgi:hypothetical protein